MRLMLLATAAIAIATPVLASSEFVVHETAVEDRKAVIATVEPVRQLVARARIGGTVTSLKVREGDEVGSGAEIALVVDQKLALQMQALDSRIRSQQAQRDQALADFNRTRELQQRGVSTQVQLELARTALDVAERTLAAMGSDREVIAQQAAEGAVLAPGAGRVLSVPVSEGRVVLSGEVIATLAEENYILRLELPERHAQFVQAGDKVLIGSRGLVASADEELREGHVRLVYPEIKGGRVVADVEVEKLGDYFVGERTRVYVTTGKREAIVIPPSFVFRRAGLNYVKLKDGTVVVVQPGEKRAEGLEILSGLKEGDVVVAP
jgi:membrane fusion protein, multidrug efflux system